MPKPTSLLLALMTTASPILLAAPAAAQEAGSEADGRGLGEIVVTAQHREEVLQNVPIAITAFNQDTLETTQTAATLDLQKVTPGLTIQVTSAGWGQPYIRGIGTASPGPGIESPVATYVDDVYRASTTSTLMSLADVQQVAVLKGPQGTLFGRNATGGLIQVTTRAPSDVFKAEGRFGYGNYDTFSSDLYLTGPIADGLAASIAGAYSNQGKGPGVNFFTGSDIGGVENYAVRGKLRWEGASTTATLIADYSKTNGSGPAVHAVGPQSTLKPGETVGSVTPGGPYDIDEDLDPFFSVEGWGVQLNVEQDFDVAKLVSITGYRATKFSVFIDLDHTRVFDDRAYINQADEQFSQELRLLSQGDGPFEWTLGGIYFWAKAGYDPQHIEFHQAPFGLPINMTLRLRSVQSLKSWAGYAQGTYKLGDATNLTLGLRYTHDSRDFAIRRDALFGQIGLPRVATGLGNFQVPVAGVDPPTAAGSADDETFKKLTWRISLDHRFSESLLAYASLNRGFKSGTYVGSNVVATVLAPETLDAYEVGIKSDLLDDTIRLNASAFYYDYKNYQTIQIQQGTLVVYNAPGTEIYGGEIEAAFDFGQLDINVGTSLLHHRYTDFPNAVFTVPLAAGGNQEVIGDAAGNRVQYVPDWTVNATATYSIPTSFGEFLLAGSYYHNDGSFAGPDNRLRRPAFDVFDASVTWTHPDKHLYLRLWGKNLTDEFYANIATANASGDTVTGTNPRKYGATFGFRF